MKLGGCVQLDENQAPLPVYESSNDTEYNRGFTDGEKKMAADMHKANYRRVRIDAI